MEHTDRTAERLVRLPMFFDLENEIERVIDICLRVVRRLDGSGATC